VKNGWKYLSHRTLSQNIQACHPKGIITI